MIGSQTRVNRLKSKAYKGFLFYLNPDEPVYLSSLAKIQHDEHGGFLSGGFCLGGFLSGGFLLGGLCPGVFVRGVLS